MTMGLVRFSIRDSRLSVGLSKIETLGRFYLRFTVHLRYTLPETNIAPEKGLFQ